MLSRGLLFLFSVLSIYSASASPLSARRTDPSVVPALARRELVHFDSPPVDLSFSIQNKNLTASVLGETVTVECINCQVFGTVDFFTTHVVQNASLIQQFEKNPVDFLLNTEKNIVNALDFTVEMQFSNKAGGYFELGVVVDGALQHAFNLFSTKTAIGVSIDGVTIGIVAFIDLVFDVTAEIDLQAGFQILFPEGASIIFNPLSGEIIKSTFDGAQVESLPVKVTLGSATFSASLLVRIQAGISIDIPNLPGTGFEFDCGVFADLIKYEAQLASSPNCAHEIHEDAIIDVGASAALGVNILSSSFGVFPSVLGVIFSTPLPTICLDATTTPPVGTGTSISLTSGIASPTSDMAAHVFHNTTSRSTSSTGSSPVITSFSNPTSAVTYTTITGSDVIVTNIITVYTTVCSNTAAIPSMPTPLFSSYSHPVVTPMIPLHPVTLSSCSTAATTTIAVLAYYAPPVVYSHPVHR